MFKHLTGKSAGVLWVLFSLCGLGQAEPVLLSELGSERSTTGPGNNIVTHDGKTHAVWQESDAKGYWAKIRTLDRATGKWSAAVTLGPGFDNHARPCIAVDSKGNLHVVIGGHNTMMFYCRSIKPNDSSAWTKREPIDNGTYPMLVCGPDDTLVLGARNKGHGGVNLYVRGPDQERWETRAMRSTPATRATTSRWRGVRTAPCTSPRTCTRAAATPTTAAPTRRSCTW
jgi:hypothetical protein